MPATKMLAGMARSYIHCSLSNAKDNEVKFCAIVLLISMLAKPLLSFWQK